MIHIFLWKTKDQEQCKGQLRRLKKTAPMKEKVQKRNKAIGTNTKIEKKVHSISSYALSVFPDARSEILYSFPCIMYSYLSASDLRAPWDRDQPHQTPLIIIIVIVIVLLLLTIYSNGSPMLKN